MPIREESSRQRVLKAKKKRDRQEEKERGRERVYG